MGKDGEDPFQPKSFWFYDSVTLWRHLGFPMELHTSFWTLSLEVVTFSAVELQGGVGHVIHEGDAP